MPIKTVVSASTSPAATTNATSTRAEVPCAHAAPVAAVVTVIVVDRVMVIMDAAREITAPLEDVDLGQDPGQDLALADEY